FFGCFLFFINYIFFINTIKKNVYFLFFLVFFFLGGGVCFSGIGGGFGGVFWGVGFSFRGNNCFFFWGGVSEPPTRRFLCLFHAHPQRRQRLTRRLQHLLT
ncbi:hypothetical protein ACVGXO_01165, partial [Enterobacter hormaechei]